jgi:hypothetical protein
VLGDILGSRISTVGQGARFVGRNPPGYSCPLSGGVVCSFICFSLSVDRLPYTLSVTATRRQRNGPRIECSRALNPTGVLQGSGAIVLDPGLAQDRHGAREWPLSVPGILHQQQRRELDRLSSIRLFLLDSGLRPHEGLTLLL